MNANGSVVWIGERARSLLTIRWRFLSAGKAAKRYTEGPQTSAAFRPIISAGLSP